MTDIIFIFCLGISFILMLIWAMRHLPKEGWQVFVSIPLKKQTDGSWQGVNLTYYGLISATAAVFAISVFLLLMVSVDVSLLETLAIIFPLLICCAPAASWVAQIVEGKKHTFTVAGAAFVGILLMPWVLLGLNALFSFDIPLLPAVAAMAIAYVIGEGLGRLACLSFGCCYGKALAEIKNPLAKRLFQRFYLSFFGTMKKISYAGGMEGVKVVPVQAMTYVAYLSCGLVSTLLFLSDHFVSAFLLSMIFSQAWRTYSETLRADYRGDSKVSAYQVMGVLGILYSLGTVVLAPATTLVSSDLLHGLSMLWDPSVILTLQAIWLGLFIYMGWSMMTTCKMSFDIQRDRI